MLTTASKITLVRVLLIPVFVVLLYADCLPAAFFVFVAASLTDFLDGYVARKYDQITAFGKLMDPLADKMLVLACMAVFSEEGRFPAWALIIVLTREFAVSGLRMLAAEGGIVIAAGLSGKVKTFSTMVGLCVMLLFPLFTPQPVMDVLDFVIMLVIAATTLYSGAEYFIKNRSVLGFKK